VEVAPKLKKWIDPQDFLGNSTTRSERYPSCSFKWTGMILPSHTRAAQTSRDWYRSQRYKLSRSLANSTTDFNFPFFLRKLAPVTACRGTPRATESWWSRVASSLPVTTPPYPGRNPKTPCYCLHRYGRKVLLTHPRRPLSPTNIRTGTTFRRNTPDCYSVFLLFNSYIFFKKQCALVHVFPRYATLSCPAPSSCRLLWCSCRSD
jgi:hypothetical protein